MAFQGAGQAMQPAPVPAASGYEAVLPVLPVLPVEKIKFDFYPIYDRTIDLTKTKEKKMGLDQYAHLRDQKPDWDKIYSDEYEPKKDGFVWRKHARLQKFMAIQHAKQNKHQVHEGNLAHLGFNGGDEPVFITEELVQELAEAIKNGYGDFFVADGFFWGQQFQEESVKENKEMDLEFLQWCRDMIAEKKVAVYHCSW